MLTLYTTGQTSSGPPVISPASASVVQGFTQQFQAQIYGAPQTAVWKVNNGPGDPTIGTITQAGLYTAPAQIPNPASVTVSATLNGQTLNDGADGRVAGA